MARMLGFHMSKSPQSAHETKNKRAYRACIVAYNHLHINGDIGHCNNFAVSKMKYIVDKLMPIIRPEFVYIAEIDGKAVGMSVTLPDYNFILKKMRGRIFPLGWLKLLLNLNKIPG